MEITPDMKCTHYKYTVHCVRVYNMQNTPFQQYYRSNAVTQKFLPRKVRSCRRGAQYNVYVMPVRITYTVITFYDVYVIQGYTFVVCTCTVSYAGSSASPSHVVHVSVFLFLVLFCCMLCLQYVPSGKVHTTYSGY